MILRGIKITQVASPILPERQLALSHVGHYERRVIFWSLVARFRRAGPRDLARGRLLALGIWVYGGFQALGAVVNRISPVSALGWNIILLLVAFWLFLGG